MRNVLRFSPVAGLLLMVIVTANPSLASSARHLALAHSSVHTVKIVGTAGSWHFQPKTIKIKPGSTVVWINESSIAHTATALNFSWNTGNIAGHHKGRHTFKKAGVFRYKCLYHNFMRGEVKVVK